MQHKLRIGFEAIGILMILTTLISPDAVSQKKIIKNDHGVSGKRDTTTISGLRSLENPSASVTYFISDPGYEGTWIFDPSDIKSIDNTATVLVSSNGRRYKRVYSGPINGKWFGINGNGADDTDPFVNALKYCTGNALELWLPAGVYKLSSFKTSMFGVITGDIKISGQGKSTTQIELSSQMIQFTGSLYLKNIAFKGSADSYMFYYHPSIIKTLIDSTTEYRTIRMENCAFDTFKRVLSAFFEPPPPNLVFKDCYVKGCTFKNIGQGGIMVRLQINNFEVTDCDCRDVLDEANYLFMFNLGDKGPYRSYGIKVHNNYFENLYNPEVKGTIESTYVVIAYARNNLFSENQFKDCRRGLYSRGDGGRMERNTFKNPTRIGRLPIIFKAGEGSPHIMTNNEFTGKFSAIGLHDNTSGNWVIENNSFDVDICGTDNYLFSVVTGGSWSLIFNGNKGKIYKSVPASTIHCSVAIDSIIIENNSIDENYITRDVNQFITCNGDGLKKLVIRNNPFLSIPSLAYTKADIRIIENNNFYMRPFNYKNWYRVNGGTYEYMINNKFLMYPNIKAVAGNFEQLFVYSGGGKINHRNIYIEGNDETRGAYCITSKNPGGIDGSVDISIRNITTGNNTLFYLYGNKDTTRLSVDSAEFLHTPSSIAEYVSTQGANNTTELKVLRTKNAGNVITKIGMGPNQPFRSIYLEDVKTNTFSSGTFSTIIFSQHSNTKPR